jgi:hypothetical protein
VQGGHAANALAEDAYAVLMFRLTTAPDDVLATIHSVLQGTDITTEVCHVHTVAGKSIQFYFECSHNRVPCVTHMLSLC